MSIRMNKLREKIEQLQLDGILVTDLNNCKYISGFTGSSAALFITNKDAILMTDFRYLEQAAVQAPILRSSRFDLIFGEVYPDW